jgi:hypothetical protein
MKETFLIAVLMTALAINVLSQTDTTSYILSRKDTTATEYNRVYHLFIADSDREINHLWKLNLIGISYTRLNLGYEIKISKKFSSDSYLNFGYDGYGYNYGWRWIGSSFLVMENIKYYYNLDRRVKLGKKNNGFSNNYFSLGVFYYSSSSSRLIPGTLYESTDPSGSDYGLNIIYGMQRRIGNIGYIDGYIGIEGSVEAGINPTFGVRAGFAIDSFKEIKKALKPR